MITITQQDVGKKLLFPLFRMLDESYKKQYLKNIWEQFENNIRSAAYTSKLGVFIQNITFTMPIQMEAKWLKDVNDVLQSGHDREILNWLRDETTYLIMIARMENEERKADYKAAQEAAATADKSDAQATAKALFQTDDLITEIPHQ